jgi:hypothetical protein
MIAQDGAELRREYEAIVCSKPVKRIRSETIRQQCERARALVDDGGAERTLQQCTEPMLVPPIQPFDDPSRAAGRRDAAFGQRRLQLLLVDELAVEQHVDGAAALVTLRSGLENTEVDASEGPLPAPIYTFLAYEASAPAHRPEHRIEAAVDILDVGPAHNSE